MWNGDYWKLSGPTKEPLFFHMSFYSQSMKLMQPNCTWRKWKAEFWALSEKLHVATGLKKITRVKIFYWTYQLSRHKQVHHSGYQRKQVTIHELCSAHWEGQKPRHWRLLVTHTHTHTSTCSLNPTTHWNTNTTKQRMFPLRQREKKRNKHTSKDHLEHVAIQTGPSSSQLRDMEINTGSHQPYLSVS